MKYNHKEKNWICILECYLTDSNNHKWFNRKKGYNSNRTKDTQNIIAVEIETNSTDSY